MRSEEKLFFTTCKSNQTCLLILFSEKVGLALQIADGNIHLCYQTNCHTLFKVPRKNAIDLKKFAFDNLLQGSAVAELKAISSLTSQEAHMSVILWFLRVFPLPLFFPDLPLWLVLILLN